MSRTGNRGTGWACLCRACGCLFLLTGSLFSHEDPADVSVPLAKLDRIEFLESGDPLRDWNPTRLWKSVDGRGLEATLTGVEGETASLRLFDGSEVAVPLVRLSERDRQFVSEWKEVSRFFDLGYSWRESIDGTIEAGIRDGAFAKEGRVHETRHFRFECDAVLGAEVVRDFSRLFEATYLVVKANPLALAIADPPAGKFRVRLFSHDADYHAAGGEPGAAGIYLLSERTMLVPLSSLGLVEGPRGFRKARNFDPRTLIHETTHALTHQWLNRVPMWFIEGFAEYVAAIPYEDGVIHLARVDEGIEAQVRRKLGTREVRLPRPADLVRTGDWEFMANPEPPEVEVVLEPIEPFQIEIVRHGMEEPDRPERDAMTEKAAEVTMSGKEPLLASPERPTVETRPVDTGGGVVERYVASMLLLHHLLSEGEEEALRRFLFAHLHFEWDRLRYLEKYTQAHRAHRSAVDEQVAEFNSKIEDFNQGIRDYNAAADAYNAGESDRIPTIPEKPRIPPALVVPEILSNPRTPEDFSRSAFRSDAVEKFLPLPPVIEIPR